MSHPPSQPQYPPQGGAPQYGQQGGQYGQPGQYPPQQGAPQYGQPGQQPYGQYPPAQGAQGAHGPTSQYPPQQGGQYGQPGQYGQYPPAQGGQYPPQGGAPGQTPGQAPGQTPGQAPGQTPQQGGQYGQPGGQFPPAHGSQYPPAQGSQYPPAQGGQYPSAQGGQYPPQQGAPQSQYGAPQGGQYGAPQGQYGAPQGQYGAQQPTQYGAQAQGQSWAASYGNNIATTEMQQLRAWFDSVDKDRSGTITAVELATLPLMGKPLGIDAAKKLIKVFDKNYTGNIDFNEYCSLHQFIFKMQGAFYAADADRSGFLDPREIFNAISGAGFQLTLQTVQTICAKYDTMKNQQISFESFIQICAHLACVRSIFEWNDAQRTGKVNLNYDQLAHITVHLLERP
eukprot:TRINITY_DN745_c0_g1_i1.p1 TRINITY_DN745_c0_g1~~TRINITY_DN745_c0_g1_i1.p1  ORF type:complete len:396 (+),score=98.47 TRINITY_DN745_c0_g1_i1:80-1267(+)